MAGFADRLCSALSYFTFGIFGIIWLIYVHVIHKKLISNFTMFNIYQSFLVSIVFAILGIAYDLIFKIFSMSDPLGQIINGFDLFLNRTPMYFGYSITGLLVTIFIGYLIIFSLLGRKPYIPFISNIIEVYTRG